MKNTKAAGTKRENQVKAGLEADGWVVIRAPASIGAADLVALKRGFPPKIIQVKANKDGGPYANFRREERAELARIAHQAGGVAELCWWPPHGKCRWLAAAVWPLPSKANEAMAA